MAKNRSNETRKRLSSWLAGVMLLLALGVTSSATAQPVTVPVNVGLGPAFFNITGPVADDQAWHYGVRLSVVAVIDQRTIEENADRIPSRYRSMVANLKEVRFSPSIFIPDTLIISPKINNTSIYGLTFRPVALGLTLIDNPVRLQLSAGALLTYAWIDSDTLEHQTTHFLRPGIDLQADLEIPLSSSLLLSGGWSSRLHVPQAIGRIDSIPGLDGTPLADAIWHWGMAYVMLHVRFPYSVNL